jgi:hypothetical protein
MKKQKFLIPSAEGLWCDRQRATSRPHAVVARLMR